MRNNTRIFLLSFLSAPGRGQNEQKSWKMFVHFTNCNLYKGMIYYNCQGER